MTLSPTDYLTRTELEHLVQWVWQNHLPGALKVFVRGEEFGLPGQQWATVKWVGQFIDHRPPQLHVRFDRRPIDGSYKLPEVLAAKPTLVLIHNSSAPKWVREFDKIRAQMIRAQTITLDTRGTTES